MTKKLALTAGFNITSDINSAANGSSRSKESLVLAVIATGLLEGASFKSVATFAENRAEFNKLVDAGKVPTCPVKGSRCSNRHYVVKLKGGKTAHISGACGDLIMDIIKGRQSMDKIQATLDKRAA